MNQHHPKLHTVNGQSSRRPSGSPTTARLAAKVNQAKGMIPISPGVYYTRLDWVYTTSKPQPRQRIAIVLGPEGEPRRLIELTAYAARI